MIRIFATYVFILCVMISCNSKNLSNSKIEDILSLNSPKLLFFFYPDCPVCLLNVNEVKEFRNSFKKTGPVYVIFPGVLVDTTECKNFMKENLPGVPFAFDREKKLAARAKTRVIPEAALLTTDNQLVYHGAIDDRFPAPGIKRIKASKLYLKEVIEKFLKGEAPEKEYVETSGCVVE